ncbi:hypothetical protein EV13_1231 [Prochlorococcus sp. MIT 0702]|nr:hypothetical protein EV12_2494 [Prochlorococcus sp. MIT 0701]KGG29279.1 hypothetical protein EV13_1231 [Prochlorococcus sp. MIT 0702]KGG35302.1 hypothetical protein EV14_0873 [Prochlorococcus sp. MIT 0703]
MELKAIQNLRKEKQGGREVRLIHPPTKHFQGPANRRAFYLTAFTCA